MSLMSNTYGFVPLHHSPTTQHHHHHQQQQQPKKRLRRYPQQHRPNPNDNNNNNDKWFHRKHDDSRMVFFMAVQQEQEQLQEQQQEQEQQVSEAERLREEARRIRLQAEQMDMNLTLQKIESLEQKLNNPVWMAKHPQQQVELREQWKRLNQKVNGRDTDTSWNNTVETKTKTTGPPFFPQSGATSSEPRSKGDTREKEKESDSPNFTTSDDVPISISSDTFQIPSTTTANNNNNNNRNVPPIAGFDADDLDLYIPIAQDINKMVPNATLAERIQLFQQAPELQQHFQAKITKLLMSPLEDLQRLEELKSEYLESNSSNERRQLKAQIQKLQESLRTNESMQKYSDATSSNAGAGIAPIVAYSDNIYCGPEVLPPLSDQQLQERFQAIQSLPDILIAIYKQRSAVTYNETALLDQDTTVDLKLAIMLDYYDLQLQLLEQARAIEPFTEENRQDFVMAFQALPRPVQERFASNIGMDDETVKECTAESVLELILKSDGPYSHPLLQVVEAGEMLASDSEYNDIDFVDRSRFLEEFFPSVANMDGQHPSTEDVELFVRECLSKTRAYMVTSKPERVVGGYYIRGQNQLSENPDQNGPTSSERLVQEISQTLRKHPTLSNKLDFFYILDPSPPTDEEMEMGAELTPILLVTSKDEQKLYQSSSFLTKSIVSLSGLASAALFTVGCCVLNPSINDRLYYNSPDGTSSSLGADVQLLLDLGTPLFLSLMGIVLAHETGHRLAAAQHKFEIGIPNIIPSITQGLAGTITPLKSPPPNNKALFDFAISGPLCGLAVSVALLVTGLYLTQAMSLDSTLPVLPVDFVRSSSLGGGLVEFFLGPTAILPNQGPNAVVQLHPFAISGFVGCLINSLALLPLGHTDGGRISLAMFGRRGAFVTKLFTTLLLVLAGLFGLDENNILLTYVLYTLIWQRELETPIRNEVDEIDFSRGLLGIAGALLVGLTLIPML
ncbi:Ulp1 protease family protein [Nitzschia inconspicua]|uniref:Ulp1 protease family protein n=1 Tax=Nitzschia inconspicua TaxID=303405 RepID=A0A9K3L6A9_9STRA|nr:Ulp1 protease family protein [Nitzschia inconspicua]